MKTRSFRAPPDEQPENDDAFPIVKRTLKAQGEKFKAENSKSSFAYFISRPLIRKKLTL
jgi:hypothetical protein